MRPVVYTLQKGVGEAQGKRADIGLQRIEKVGREHLVFRPDAEAAEVRAHANAVHRIPTVIIEVVTIVGEVEVPVRESDLGKQVDHAYFGDGQSRNGQRRGVDASAVGLLATQV